MVTRQSSQRQVLDRVMRRQPARQQQPVSQRDRAILRKTQAQEKRRIEAAVEKNKVDQLNKLEIPVRIKDLQFEGNTAFREVTFTSIDRRGAKFGTKTITFRPTVITFDDQGNILSRKGFVFKDKKARVSLNETFVNGQIATREKIKYTNRGSVDTRIKQNLLTGETRKFDLGQQRARAKRDKEKGRPVVISAKERAAAERLEFNKKTGRFESRNDFIDSKGIRRSKRTGDLTNKEKIRLKKESNLSNNQINKINKDFTFTSKDIKSFFGNITDPKKLREILERRVPPSVKERLSKEVVLVNGKFKSLQSKDPLSGIEASAKKKLEKFQKTAKKGDKQTIEGDVNVYDIQRNKDGTFSINQKGPKQLQSFETKQAEDLFSQSLQRSGLTVEQNNLARRQARTASLASPSQLIYSKSLGNPNVASRFLLGAIAGVTSVTMAFTDIARTVQSEGPKKAFDKGSVAVGNFLDQNFGDLLASEGQRFLANPAFVVGEFAGVSSGFSVAGKSSRVSSQVARSAAETSYLKSIPKKFRAVHSKVLDSFIGKKKIDLTGKMHTLAPRANGPEIFALGQAIRKTSDSAVLKTKKGSKSILPVEQLIYINDFGKFARLFQKSLPKGVRNQYSFKNGRIVHKPTKRLILDARDLEKIVKTKVSVQLPKSAVAFARRLKLGGVKTLNSVQDVSSFIKKKTGKGFNTIGIRIGRVKGKIINITEPQLNKIVELIEKFILKPTDSLRKKINNQLNNLGITIAFSATKIRALKNKGKKNLVEVSNLIKKQKNKLKLKFDLEKVKAIQSIDDLTLNKRRQISKIIASLSEKKFKTIKSVQKQVRVINRKLKVFGHKIKISSLQAQFYIEGKVGKITVPISKKLKTSKEKLSKRAEALRLKADIKVSRLRRKTISSINKVIRPLSKSKDGVSGRLSKIKGRVITEKEIAAFNIKSLNVRLKEFTDNKFTSKGRKALKKINEQIDLLGLRLNVVQVKAISNLSKAKIKVVKSLKNTFKEGKLFINNKLVKLNSLSPLKIKVVEAKLIGKFPDQKKKIKQQLTSFGRGTRQQQRLRTLEKQPKRGKVSKARRKELRKGTEVRTFERETILAKRRQRKKIKEQQLKERRQELQKIKRAKAQKKLEGRRLTLFNPITGKTMKFNSPKQQRKAAKSLNRLLKSGGGKRLLRRAKRTRGDKKVISLTDVIVETSTERKVFDSTGKLLFTEKKAKKTPSKDESGIGVQSFTTVNSGDQQLIKKFKSANVQLVKQKNKFKVLTSKKRKRNLTLSQKRKQAKKLNSEIKPILQQKKVADSMLKSKTPLVKRLGKRLSIAGLNALKSINAKANSLGLDRSPAFDKINIKAFEKANLRDLIRDLDFIKAQLPVKIRKKATARDVAFKRQQALKQRARVRKTKPQTRVKTRDERPERLREITNRVVKKETFIYIPDLYSRVFGIKASKAEKKQLLKIGRTFTGLERRALVGRK